MTEIKGGHVPICKYCKGIVRPKVVLYGEMLYDGVTESAIEHITNADLLIVGGTSLAVHPAASFVRYFRGNYIVIINKTATDFDNNADLVLRNSIGTVFEELMKKVK